MITLSLMHVAAVLLGNYFTVVCYHRNGNILSAFSDVTYSAVTAEKSAKIPQADHVD